MAFLKFLQYTAIGLSLIFYWNILLSLFTNYASGAAILIVLLSASLGIFIASKQKKNPLLWAIISSLLGPGFGCIPSLAKKKKCPYCQRTIATDVKTCGYCGKDLV